MNANPQFQTIHGATWRRGLQPLLAREYRNWWQSRRWLVQALLWTALLNGMLMVTLFILPQIAATDSVALTPADAFELGVQIFFGLGTMALSIGTVVLLQDAIIEEKTSGTIEWLLSKPVSRTAYILARLVPNLLGMAVTMLLIPGAIGFAIFRVFDPQALSLSGFLASGGIVALHLIFYCTLTLLLGVLFRTRPPLLGIALGSLFGGSLVPLAQVVQFTPWKLGDLAVLPALGIALPPIALTMLLSTGVWSLIFLGVAIWQFNRQEF